MGTGHRIWASIASRDHSGAYASMGNGSGLHLSMELLKSMAGIVKQLHDGSVTALQSKELRERFASDGVKPIGSTPEELTKYIQSERLKWTEVVKRSGATVE